ncbi:MAG: hypothetical protein JXB15_01900 [Anaerolineales bacterium]|nr:hypothetical protein [Anaerolineales bacterium]
MSEEKKYPPNLPPQELEAIYAISQAVAGGLDQEATLNQITRLLRSIFIFDSVVLYEERGEAGLEPVYARAIGRGRFREADLAWGELTAQDTYQSGTVVVRIEESSGSKEDRTNVRHSLGLPLKISDLQSVGQTLCIGGLVFIRFGGPNFTSEQIHLAEFVAVHIAQLIERHRLVEQVASLEAHRKLDSLQDDFISTITHELLTPLGFIKGYASTLLREDTDWDEQYQREFLTYIEEEADRLHELIDMLLDSSRLQTGTLQMTFQTIRVEVLLKEICQRGRSMSDKMHIDLEVIEPGLQIWADPTRLTQVFDNILNNAIKYAPGSRLTITLDKDGEQARIAIRDFGPGIAQEHLLKIFSRFYRVPEKNVSVRGTGLGLYICRKIIQAHGGDIYAQSTPGHGTTFIILLPCHDNNIQK